MPRIQISYIVKSNHFNERHPTEGEMNKGRISLLPPCQFACHCLGRHGGGPHHREANHRKATTVHHFI